MLLLLVLLGLLLSYAYYKLFILIPWPPYVFTLFLIDLLPFYYFKLSIFLLSNFKSPPIPPILYPKLINTFFYFSSNNPGYFYNTYNSLWSILIIYSQADFM